MPNLNHFYTLEVKTSEIALDEKTIREAWDHFSCDGVQVFNYGENELEAMFDRDQLLWSQSDHHALEVLENKLEQAGKYKFYFFSAHKDEENAFRAEELLKKIKGEYRGLDAEIKRLPYEDWTKLCRESFRPIAIGKSYFMAPPWEKIENRKTENREVILINPGMGFGTGEHETTCLCLRFLENLKINGPALDFGCGSGILGIAALKKKIYPVVFCDIDNEALDNCLENLKLNFPEGGITTGSQLLSRENLEEKEIEKKYSLIFANILRSTLLEERDTIVSRLAPGGHLIASGLLIDQLEEIKDAYLDLGLSFVEKIDGKEWSAILMRMNEGEAK